ncbi:MAG: 50S ribosomal protein L19e [Desulfurococcales archaeon]|nr:50S ribosomal protein L19e [Desulfurococcales archaeon]MEB3765247.1 50S ribosomal protein L19e [Desulfurococcales archaeon]
MDYRLQRRLAAEILGVGESRIWISPDPEHEEEISQAVTKADVMALIKQGLIQVRPKKGNSHRWLERHRQRRKGRRRGYGRRKGKQTARHDPKRDWITRIRKIRRYLRWLRDHEVIDRRTYRRLYRLAKGGSFKNLADLRRHMIEEGILKGEQ